MIKIKKNFLAPNYSFDSNWTPITREQRMQTFWKIGISKGAKNNALNALKRLH